MKINNRQNGQNYAENLVDSVLLFDEGTWTIASGTGTASLDTNNIYVGNKSLKVENNVVGSAIVATNSVQNTVIGLGGAHQISFYAKKDIALEVRSFSLLIYKNAVLLDTQTFSIGSTDGKEDINNKWVRFQCNTSYTFAKGDVVTFQFRINSATTSELTTFLFFDGFMLNRDERLNKIAPIYDKPIASKSQNLGIYDYNDSATSVTPIDLVADTWALLTNNGSGAFTNKTYALSGVSDVFNTSTNLFDFSDLELGDIVNIRIDVLGTTTTTNQDFDIDLVLAYGTLDEYRIPFIVEQSYKSAGEHPLISYNSIYIGNTDTLNNSARFEIKSSDTATVVVNGWYINVLKRLS